MSLTKRLPQVSRLLLLDNMPDLIKQILYWYTSQKDLHESYEAWVSYMMSIRDAKLIEVDAIERAIKMKPRTSEIRQRYKGS